MWFRGSFECCSSSSAQTVSFLVPALLAKISHLNNVSIRNVKRNKKANWPIYSSDTTMKPNFLLLKLINSQQLQDVKANGKLRLAIVSIQIFWYTGTFQSTISKQSVVCCPPFASFHLSLDRNSPNPSDPKKSTLVAGAVLRKKQFHCSDSLVSWGRKADSYNKYVFKLNVQIRVDSV